MADIAGIRKTSLGVTWVIGAVVIRHVAGRARGTAQVVIAVHMAERASGVDVRARQRETGQVVVERGIQP